MYFSEILTGSGTQNIGTLTRQSGFVFVVGEITTDPAREFGSSESDHWNLFDFQALTSLFVVFFYVANPDFFPVGYLQS